MSNSLILCRHYSDFTVYKEKQINVSGEANYNPMEDGENRKKPFCNTLSFNCGKPQMWGEKLKTIKNEFN